MIVFLHYDSPVGGITLAGEADALCGLWFDGQKFFASGLESDKVNRFLAAGQSGETSLPVLAVAERWLDLYFSGHVPDFTPKIRWNDTEFRVSVWKKLLEIPYGKTTSYGEIARQISRDRGSRVSAQAVGQAVGHNPISLIVPCHRVTGADGSLTGYAGGLDKKRWLLEMEKKTFSGNPLTNG